MVDEILKKVEETNYQEAMLGAGCFWGVQYVFDMVIGVVNTQCGYSGGLEAYDNPNYVQVCSGKTEHAEVVHIIFNPEKVSYEKILDFFWRCHDPTQLDRQGEDIGSQYRSVIFYYDEEQKALAEKTRKEWEERIGKRIVTEIKKAKPFFRAEEYHQKYYMTHPKVCHNINLLK